MAYNPYGERYRPEMDANRDAVLSNYEYCTSQLSELGAPFTVYIDIFWDGSHICELSTGNVIQASGVDIKFKYFGHLRGLFRKAYENRYFSP